jgi:hypothetical protein
MRAHGDAVRSQGAAGPRVALEAFQAVASAPKGDEIHQRGARCPRAPYRWGTERWNGGLLAVRSSGRQDVRRLDVPVYVDSPEPDVASGGEDKRVRVAPPGSQI